MPRGEYEVHDTYQQIFENDPLLFEAHNRSAYSEALLKHLLLNRTVNSCEPHDLIVTDPESRANFEEQTSEPPPRPEASAVNAYRKSLKIREPMTDDRQFAEIMSVTMASDSQFTAARAKKTYTTHTEAVTAVDSAGKSPNIADRLRIAVVGYRVKISKLLKSGYLDEDLCRIPLEDDLDVKGLPEGPSRKQLRQTVRLSDQKQWEDTILSHIEAALKHEPHIVLLPEFALPFDDKKAAKPIDVRLEEKARQAKKNVFVFAGSRHEGSYNRGLVLAKEGETVKPWWHYKVAPARKLGENILGPKGIRMPTYINAFEVAGRTKLIACTIAVCYDAFDISMFLNLIKLSVRSGTRWSHLVILVPSFNTSPDFVAMLRDLSFLARSVVVYVNGLHGDAKMFICGFAISEILDKRQQIVTRARALRDELDTLLDKEDVEFRARVQRNPQESRSPAENEQKSDWERMQRALNDMAEDLAALEGSGSLSHLITIEAQPPSENDVNAVIGQTADDILYYNIDMRFLQLLKVFRSEFFLNDKFLPKPFHSRELQAAFGKPDKKIQVKPPADVDA